MAWAIWPAISLALSHADAPLSGKSGGSLLGWSLLDGGEGPPHYQLDRFAVQPAEDTRADAGDEEDPELLQMGFAAQGPGQHLLAGDEDGSRVSGSRETAGRIWISLLLVSFETSAIR